MVPLTTIIVNHGSRLFPVNSRSPVEAAGLLLDWPEPDFDDPAPEIYATREQIEE
jgi:hypothetical protein